MQTPTQKRKPKVGTQAAVTRAASVRLDCSAKSLASGCFSGSWKSTTLGSSQVKRETGEVASPGFEGEPYLTSTLKEVESENDDEESSKEGTVGRHASLSRVSDNGRRKSMIDPEVSDYVDRLLRPEGSGAAHRFSLVFDASPGLSPKAPLSAKSSQETYSPSVSDGKLNLAITLEDEAVHKGLKVDVNATFDEVAQKIEQKLNMTGLSFYFKDDDGDKIAVDDDITWEVFCERRGKLKLVAKAAQSPTRPKNKEGLPTTSLSREFVLKGHTGPVYCCAISPDRKVAITGGKDGVARVWNSKEGSWLFDFQRHAHYILCCAISPSGKIAATGSFDGVVLLWEVATGKILHTIKDHLDRVYDIKFSPDGTVIATASCDRKVRVYRAADAALLRTFEGHTDGVICVGFASRTSSSLLCSGSDDTTLHLWDWKTGTDLGQMPDGHTKTVWCCSFSADDELMISSALSPEVLVWDMTTKRISKRLRGHGVAAVHRVVFVGHRTFVTCARDSCLAFWNLERPNGEELVSKAKGHDGVVYSVQAAGSTLITSSADGTACIWNIS
ncbi:putative WD repeat-containing protein [Diplonema papillatum]|nr:putative WD repeat-containing protein [Diplonema papillatum]